jgi:DNA polymerase
MLGRALREAGIDRTKVYVTNAVKHFKFVPRGNIRGQLIARDRDIQALVAVHPSYLLRLPDADAKAREYERFIDDLRIAAALLKKDAHAA